MLRSSGSIRLWSLPNPCGILGPVLRAKPTAHIGIDDRRTNETESATLKVLAESIGFDRSRRNLSHAIPLVKLGLSVNETLAIGVEASRNACALRTAASIFMRLRMISEFYAAFRFVEPNIVPLSGDQPIESAPITFPPLQGNRHRPTQPGPCTFEHQKLKLLAVIVDWNTHSRS